MAARLVLLLGCLLPATGCLESSYSSTSHPMPAASIPNPAPAIAQPPAAAEIATERAVTENSAPAPPAAPANPPAEAPALYVADGSAKPERRELPIKNITFDDIKFDIQKDSMFEPSMLTPKIEELVGRKVRVRGYILPTPQQTIRQFVLMRDNLECCFGPGAAIYDCVQVAMVPNTTAEYTTRPVTAEGVLTLREIRDFDGITRAIYYLDATSVK